MAGMKYSVGTRFNFSVAAGVSEVIKIRVGKAGQLDGVDVSGAAFRFYYAAPTGPMRLPVEHGAELGVLNLSVPKLEPGELSYSLEFTDALGQNGVLLYGVLTVISRQHADALMNAAEAAEQRVLAVTAGSLHDGPVELRWSASSMAAVYAEDAKAAALRAEEAAGDVAGLGDDVSATLQLAMAFMESFNKALRESITVVDNYLYVGGVNTGHYVKGEDAPIPEYRADGYLYLDGKRVAKIKGEDGITPHITADKFWAIGAVKTKTRAEGRDGLDGTAVRRVLIQSTAELPAGEERGVLYYVKQGDKLYDVYAWLDRANAWVNVKETYDIATDEVHGLMKFSAGALADGAPVGWREDDKGTAVVPMSDTAVPGVGKLGSGVLVDFGAPVGLNADGAYYVGPASVEAFGAIKLSFRDVLADDTDGGPVGVSANGGAMVPWATLDRGGCIRLGSRYGQSNPLPYRVGIGATQNHELANNYAFGGALQHRDPAGWRGTMPWLDNAMVEHPGYFNDMFYSGLMTSAQFSQSQNGGLELLSATADLLAGVYLATGKDDVRGAAVVSAGLLRRVDEELREWVRENYYTRELVHTKEEVGRILEAYLTRSSAAEVYATSEALSELMERVVLKSDKLMPCRMVTEEEYNALGDSLDENVAYIII